MKNLELGNTVITLGATKIIEEDTTYYFEIATCLQRHQHGDWGELDEDDWAVNNYAYENNQRILSAYTLTNGKRIWIITEWDRQLTTILLPEEY